MNSDDDRHACTGKTCQDVHHSCSIAAIQACRKQSQSLHPCTNFHAKRCLLHKTYHTIGTDTIMLCVGLCCFCLYSLAFAYVCCSRTTLNSTGLGLLLQIAGGGGRAVCEASGPEAAALLKSVTEASLRSSMHVKCRTWCEDQVPVAALLPMLCKTCLLWVHQEAAMHTEPASLRRSLFENGRTVLAQSALQSQSRR